MALNTELILSVVKNKLAADNIPSSDQQIITEINKLNKNITFQKAVDKVVNALTEKHKVSTEPKPAQKSTFIVDWTRKW